jgi:type III restriction enzyme
MAGVGAQAMSTDFFQHPILNSPYKYPARHWELDDVGQPTQQISEFRRPVSFITPIPKPRRVKKNAQVSLILDEGKGISSGAQQYDPTGLINELRGHCNLPLQSQTDRSPSTHHTLPPNDRRRIVAGS